MKELIIISGANGSGKTTFSKQILAEAGLEFLNADEIEKELAISKLKAGKEFFSRLDKFIETGTSFILESTLSGKYLAIAIERAKVNGYLSRLSIYFWKAPKTAYKG